ncbi:MAG: hypothetical protein CMC41_03850 [Flavobacteriaceae bacterium]|nr:hypothetical protein [Flavobacteriaceae bacterium]|tara:strand:- start:132 stop:881 length:750 start_codon:yes stop_codon:yes gene_type:complete
MSLKKYFIKYTFEIIVIVMGISISFFIEDIRQKNELKHLTKDLRNNLLSEIYQIENYLKIRLEGFDNDLKIVNFLKINDKNSRNFFNSENEKNINIAAAIFNYRGFSPPVSFYNSLVNDGKIRYLESSEIKTRLDELHTSITYFIKANMEDEITVLNKIVSHFQNNYPRIYIEIIQTISTNSYNNSGFISNTQKLKFLKKIKLISSTDQKFKSLLYEKGLAMNAKLDGLKIYIDNINFIKNILQKKQKL